MIFSTNTKKMINPKIIDILLEHDIDEAKGIAFLYSLYIGNYNISWIEQEVRAKMKLLKIISFEGEHPKFSMPLFINATEPVINIKDSDIKTFVIKDFIPLFPTQSETGLPYAISGNTAACVTRMTKFVKEFNKLFNAKYPQSEIFSLILRATKNYLEEKRCVGYGYTKKNVKFISDENGSELENRVRNILTGNLTSFEQLMKLTKEM